MNFKAITIRQHISHRGGGIEIDLLSYGFKGERMTAYQYYLGGGLLGSVQVNDTIDRACLSETENEEMDIIAEELKQYFHSLTNPDTEWESMSYEQNQIMPASAY